MAEEADLVRQYEAQPADGMNRYWMRFASWFEDWPEMPFFAWQTASGMDYRLRPSVKGRSGTDLLLERPSGTAEFSDEAFARFFDPSDEDWFDRLYVSDGYVCVLLDAVDEDTAWAIVKASFPDAVPDFCNAAPDKTLVWLAEGGRFGHPAPTVDGTLALQSPA